MRKEGWESQLSAYLDASTSFVWGQADCALWSALWVKDCTGQDYTQPWLGKYKTAKGAALRIKKHGFSSVADIASSHLEEISPPLAKRGDIVLHPVQDCLGICNGLRSHFLMEKGTTTVATLACRRAWRVG